MLILVHVAIIAHFLHWRFRGETLTPVEPSESMSALRDGLINAGLVFFALALLTTLLFGRWVCGWLCHLVALQDACSWLLKKFGIRPKPLRSRLLLWAPLGLALYLFVWQPLAPRLLDGAPPLPDGGVQIALVDEDFWGTFPPLAIAIPFLLVCGAVTIYFLGAKGFCTYACPYGGFFVPLDKASPLRIKVDPDACDGSAHCTAVCTSNVRVHQEVRDYGAVMDPGCMKCMDCISACPNDALSLGFTKPALLTKTKKPERSPRGLTLGEEMAAGVTFLAVLCASFRAYGPDLFPLLFAGGIAACCAPLGIALWNLPRRANLRFARLQLKRDGAWTKAGVTTGLLGLAMIAITAHTGLVNYHRWRLDVAFNAVNAPAQAYLSQRPPALTDEQRETLETGLEHHEAMTSISPLFNERAHGRVAVMQLALGQYDDALAAFTRIDEKQRPDDLVSATRAEVLIRTGDIDGAYAYLDQRTTNHPDFWQARDVFNRILASRGEFEDAITRATTAYEAMPDRWTTRDARARTLAQRSNLHAAMRNGPAAVEDARLAVEIAPRLAPVREQYAAMLLRIAGEPNAAIAEMRRVTELTPRDVGVWTRFAQLGIALRRPELVRECADRILDIQNESDEAKGLVAELYRAAGISPDG